MHLSHLTRRCKQVRTIQTGKGNFFLKRLMFVLPFSEHRNYFKNYSFICCLQKPRRFAVSCNNNTTNNQHIHIHFLLFGTFFVIITTNKLVVTEKELDNIYLILKSFGTNNALLLVFFCVKPYLSKKGSVYFGE